MARKSRELGQRTTESGRIYKEKVQMVETLECLERDAAAEREACLSAREVMDGELDRRKEANKRRADFESWRHEVALEAANEAFNASAGRLRKLYAIEKLAGNMLQKITFEQVERSQSTEDGFQQTREVTGLADVMDIVHKFLNRTVEEEQLKSSVAEAEPRLELLRDEFENFKRDTDGITFDTDSNSRTRDIYLEVEDHESLLNNSLKDNELSRDRLQRSTLQVEHMKRWANRVGRMLASFEDSAQVKTPADLPIFFQ